MPRAKLSALIYDSTTSEIKMNFTPLSYIFVDTMLL